MIDPRIVQLGTVCTVISAHGFLQSNPESKDSRRRLVQPKWSESNHTVWTCFGHWHFCLMELMDSGLSQNLFQPESRAKLCTFALLLLASNSALVTFWKRVTLSLLSWRQSSVEWCLRNTNVDQWMEFQPRSQPVLARNLDFRTAIFILHANTMFINVWFLLGFFCTAEQFFIWTTP